ncbi:MAG: capsular exopolysaccharide family [Myxococcaceae bacterium]|nr:capsular exopolysaccharide family [Myxococcaceae bacterium]
MTARFNKEPMPGAKRAPDAFQDGAQRGPVSPPPQREVPAEMIDVAQVLSLLRANAWFIALCTAGAMAVGLTVVLLSRMEFSVTGRLYLGDVERGSHSGAFESHSEAPSDVTSETEILRSNALLMRAIRNAGLNVSINRAGSGSPRFYRWLFSRRDQGLIDSGLKLITVAKARLTSDASGPIRVNILFTSSEDFVVRDVEGKQLASGRLRRPVTTKKFEMLVSEGTEGSLRKGAEFDATILPMDIAVRSVQAALKTTSTKVSASEQAKVLTLEFNSRSPQNARDFVNELMLGYLEERQNWKSARASAAEAFITNQLAALRDSLRASEGELAEYRSSHSGLLLDTEAKALVEQIAQYEHQRVSARLQVASLGDIKRALSDPKVPLEAYLIGDSADPVLATQAQALMEARLALIDISQRYSSDSAEVRNQRAQVDVQRSSVANYVNTRLSRAHEQLASLNGIVHQFEERLKGVPGAEAGIAQLARESDVYGKMYSYLLERQQQAGIEKVSTLSSNRILDRAELPYQETSPNLARGAATGVLGFLFAIAVVLGRRFGSSKLQNAADLKITVSNAPILAEVPTWTKGADFGFGERHGMLPQVREIRAASGSPFVEAFRALSASLHGLTSLGAPQMIVTTSPTPGDGKTMTSIWLAAILASEGKLVLLVDGDLRKPSHDELLGNSSRHGLRSLLSGACAWREAVCPVRFCGQEIFSLGAGPMAPAELVSSERMRRFLAEARDSFDYVIIDAASYPLVADALVLSRMADCVLTVMRIGHTPRKVAHEHMQRLSAAANLVVVVANASPTAPNMVYGDTLSGQSPR